MLARGHREVPARRRRHVVHRVRLRHPAELRLPGAVPAARLHAARSAAATSGATSPRAST
ncbi:hypothetical protein ACU686_01690 [Yinghuangia aomiensis]